MARNFRNIQKHPLLTEILVAIIATFFISSVIFLAFFIHYYTDEMESAYEERIESDSQFISNAMDMMLNMLRIRAYTLGSDTTLNNLRQRYFTDPENISNFILLESYLTDKLNEIQLAFSSVINSVAYIANDNIFSNNLLVIKRDERARSFIQSLEEIEGNNFVTRLEEMDNPIYFSSDSVIPIVYVYVSGHSRSYLVAFIDVTKLASFIVTSYSNYFEGAVVRNTNGDILAQSGIIFIDSGSEMIKIDGKQYLAISYDDSFASWNISLLKDISDMKERIFHITIILSIIMLLLLIIGIIAIILIYNRFANPLKRFIHKMLNNSQNANYSHFDYTKQDEIGMLASCYNKVIDKVEDLVTSLNGKITELEEEKKQREWEEKQKRIAEIKALQAQINPHFLYNALNAIVWTATDNDDKEAADFALRLAQFYQTNLSDGVESIPLSTEINHAENYLWIQKKRYEDIGYRFSIDNSLLSVMIPKLILQPLIENAIYHGIKPKGGKGMINIIVEQDENNLILSVKDDGIGIPSSLLSIIQEKLREGSMDETTGYGIYNVNSRLKLTFSSQYGLFIESIEGRGTVSKIVIPSEGMKL